MDFILTDGEVYDSQCVEALLEGKNAYFVIANKAYDTNVILNKITQIGTTAIILFKSNRKQQGIFDKHSYKDRNLIE